MKLTEDVIVTRTRRAKIQDVKELNLCGYNITDISILAKMPNIEVLALSVNAISSLAPLEKCYKLKELYLRRNAIEDIAEIYRLQKLPMLTKLWLIENPFCDHLGMEYRETILSILPKIRVLDNVAVTQEEIDQSKYVGLDYPQFTTVPYNLPHNGYLAPPVRTQQSQAPPPATTPAPAPVPDMHDLSGSQDVSRNVLAAIWSLVKDLDVNSLEEVHHQIGSRLSDIYSERR